MEGTSGCFGKRLFSGVLGETEGPPPLKLDVLLQWRRGRNPWESGENVYQDPFMDYGSSAHTGSCTVKIAICLCPMVDVAGLLSGHYTSFWEWFCLACYVIRALFERWLVLWGVRVPLQTEALSTIVPVTDHHH